MTVSPSDQDMVNRRISMDMMLKVAGSQRYRQFIFLTPQSMRYTRHMPRLELLVHRYRPVFDAHWGFFSHSLSRLIFGSQFSS